MNFNFFKLQTKIVWIFTNYLYSFDLIIRMAVYSHLKIYESKKWLLESGFIALTFMNI